MELAVLPEDIMVEAANYLFAATSLFEDEDLSPEKPGRGGRAARPLSMG